MAISKTNFKGVKLLHRGKVRDIYDAGDMIIIVATDRLSAFDVVLPTPIPDKGRILTQLSLFWFDRLGHIISNHLVTADVKGYPVEFQPYCDVLEGRSMLVKKADPLPIECIVRGYITGSGWKDYQKTGSICGIKLPAGLKESERLPEPLFTPSTKAEAGSHDENISFEQAASRIGMDLARQARDTSLRLYTEAADYALKKGIIIADTKFEFGIINGQLILIDEVLTPDSSRFWPVEGYRPGQSQLSFDKQFVRDYLESISWDKTPPGPELLSEIVERTRKRYQEAYDRLAG